MKTYERAINGNKVISILKKPEEIKSIKNLKVTQVTGICFTNNGDVMIISNKPGKWGLPGGKPENSETFKETLRREVKEEACIELGKVLPIAFLEIHFPQNPNKEEGELFYQARYATLIKNINKMTIDPATKTLFKRKFIKLKDFTQYIRWPEAQDLIELASAALNILKSYG